MGDHTREMATRGPIAQVRSRRVSGLIDPRTVKRRAQKILVECGQKEAELSVLLCDDSTIRELNRLYRAVDRATDVLAFPQSEIGQIPGVPRILGDVVISIETAARQARARRRGLSDEITTLLIHGVLHLLGHDHERSDERRAMNAAARELELLLLGKGMSKAR